MPKEIVAKEKSTRGNASQFFIAGELCRRGYSAVVTLGNTPKETLENPSLPRDNGAVIAGQD